MAKTTVPPAPTLLNRELSWLDFNERVLALAADDSMPLLERVKFCSIFASNLDEFFMVRVAGLMDQAASGLPVRSHDGLTPREALAAIRERLVPLMSEHSRLWRKVVRPALAEEGILVGHVTDCRGDELAELDRMYERELFPVLTPLGVGPGQPFPYISPLSLSLGVHRPRSRHGRGALRPGQGARAAAALRRRGRGTAAAAARGRDRPLPRLALPRHGDPRARLLPRHARRRHGALRRRGRPAPGGAGRDQAAPLRRRRAGRGGLVDVGRDGRASSATDSASPTTRSTRSTACSTCPR